MVYVFEDWEFDSASGELRRADGHIVRIQPQPALLLELLLKRAGTVVTRDDIVREVWPDTHVEFDQSVNYSIRHLRVALGDSATDSRYVETLARRGYRFKPTVTRSDDSSPATTRTVRVPIAVAAVGGLVLAGLIGATQLGSDRDETAGSGTPVVAVMVLRHAVEDSTAAVTAYAVAERLTARLTNTAQTRARVIGPRSTEDYRTGGGHVLRRLQSEAGVDYLLSGSVTPGEGAGLFLELIRTSDGAHLWAMTASLTDTAATSAAADSVAARLDWR